MRHPGEALLSLYAGGDLGWLERWRVQWHLGGCEDCRKETEAFRAARQALLSGAVQTPAEVNWGRLAAEMRANIQVGLAAGQCVGPAKASPLKPGWRTAIALATVVVVMLAGVWLQRTRPQVALAPPSEDATAEGVVLEATTDGIQLREGSGVLALRYGDARDVTYTVSARGTLRARYVDQETGQVTISHVYAE